MQKTEYTPARSRGSFDRCEKTCKGLSVGISGTGCCLPANVITNEDLAGLIAQHDKGATWARDKLGIEGRRFMTPLDQYGKPVADTDELDMAEHAARAALASAAVSAEQVDALW